MRYEKFITRQMLKDNPNILFVFGDNMIRRGLGGQAAEMRGEQNAVGIPTKMLPERVDAAFFRDEDFPRVKAKIDEAFLRLFCHAGLGNEVVWPKDGIGTGLADLQNKAPEIWKYIEYLREMLDRASTR